MAKVPFETKYKLEQLLGSGAFAKVHLVTNATSGERYAAKLAENNSESRKAFKKEVEIYRAFKNWCPTTSIW